MNNAPEMQTEETVGIPVYPEITLEDAADRLERAENVLIFGHNSPDGDCVGSAFGLAELLLAMGKRAAVSVPGEIPKRLRFLCGGIPCLILPESVPEEYDTVLAVDTASPMQLGENRIHIPQIGFMLDHHGMGEPFAPHYVDSAASAAGEIVYRLYRMFRERGKIGTLPEAARRIYAAIVSDTGSFKFSNTTPETHRIAAALVEEVNSADDGGMDTADVCRSLFGQRTLKELTAQMLAIQSLRFYEDGKVGAVLFTQQMLADAGLTEEEIGNVVDTPRGVEGVLIGISVRQTAADPAQYKISSRANADVDCAAVCAAFGGGGHTRAAGCTITADSPEDALNTAAAAFAAAIREKFAPESEDAPTDAGKTVEE